MPWRQSCGRLALHTGWTSIPFDFKIRRILLPVTTAIALVLPPLVMRSAQHTLHLSNAVGVTEDDTDLRGSGTLLRELADLVVDLLGGGLEPCGRAARVGDGRSRYSLSVGVKSTHGGWSWSVVRKSRRGRLGVRSAVGVALCAKIRLRRSGQVERSTMSWRSNSLKFSACTQSAHSLKTTASSEVGCTVASNVEWSQ